MPSPSTASQSRINAERLAHLLPKGNPPDSIRPEHALILLRSTSDCSTSIQVLCQVVTIMIKLSELSFLRLSQARCPSECGRHLQIELIGPPSTIRLNH